MSSYVTWAERVVKTNMILQLVDNEKNKVEKASASPTVDQAETASNDDQVQIIEPRTTNDGEVDIESTAASDSTTTTTSTINLPKAAKGERKGRKTKTAAATQQERDEKEKKDHIPYDKFVTQLNGGARIKHSSCKGHSLEWQDGTVFCKVCGHTRITQLKNMHRRIISITHIEKLAQAQNSKVPLYQDGLNLVDPHAMGAHQDQDTPTLAYRMKAMIAAGLHNIPVANVTALAEDWVNEYAHETLGNAGDFVALTAPALRAAIIERIRDIVGGLGCFDEFAVKFDGTPSFAEVEAVVIRFVTKDWNIIEILVRCGLYGKKLKSDELKSHVIDTTTNRVGLQLKNWMSTHQDRAKTNHAAHNKIYEDQADAKPAKNDCQ